METFAAIEVRRLALAQEYLTFLSANHGRPLALFAPPDVGKTFFLNHDLVPEAERAGLLPVYVDFGLHHADPVDAVSGPLEAALAKQRNGRILLLLDEVQTLSDTPEGTALVANLRSVITTRHKELCAVLTGSSQAGLLRLMSTLGTTLDPFAQLISFPNLGDDFLQALADHFRAVRPGKELAMAELKKAFSKVGFKPAVLKELVRTLAVHGITDFQRGFEIFLSSDAQVAGWIDLLKSITSFDRGVLITIAKGLPPLSLQALTALQVIPGSKPSVENVRASIGRLKRAGILSMGAGLSIEDDLLADYMAKQALGDRST